MKPIYNKGLKPRQSTPTLHGPGEVYNSYESVESKCQSTRFLTLNIGHQMNAGHGHACGTVGVHMLKLKQADGLYNIVTL